MLKKLLKRLKSFFGGKGTPPPADNGRSQPYMRLGEMDGNVRIKTQSQLDKRTHFKPGEQYRVGEAIVTVHASKADARRAVLMTYLKRRAKRSALNERAIELMLMTPKELEALKINEWLTKRELKHKPLLALARKKILGYSEKASNKIVVTHEPLPPTPLTTPKDESTVKVKVREKIK